MLSVVRRVQLPNVYSGKRVRFKRVFVEGVYVNLYCHQEWPTDKYRHRADLDIYRLDDDGKLVDHWKVLQVAPNTSANSNTMF